MTGRERLLRAIRHEPVDRVPISAYELRGMNPAAWENNEPSYKRLMDAVREYTDCLYMLNPLPLPSEQPPHVESEERVFGKAHVVRTVYHTKFGDLTMRTREDEGLHTRWTLEHLLKEPEDIGVYLSLPYEPAKYDFAAFDAECARVGEGGLVMVSVPDPVCQAADLFEMGDFLMLAVTKTNEIKYLLDALHERQMHELKAMLSHSMRNVVFRICGPEYCTPPYLAPWLFGEFVTCYLHDICRVIRRAGAIPRIHCHGKIKEALYHFAETDALALDPLEPPPDGDIELKDIKTQYGKQFCLFGNIELRELECADLPRIDELVRQAMEDAKEDGGFVLMPTSAPINVPLSERTEANYLQMFESAHKYGRY